MYGFGDQAPEQCGKEPTAALQREGGGGANHEVGMVSLCNSSVVAYFRKKRIFSRNRIISHDCCIVFGPARPRNSPFPNLDNVVCEISDYSGITQKNGDNANCGTFSLHCPMTRARGRGWAVGWGFFQVKRILSTPSAYLKNKDTLLGGGRRNAHQPVEII